MKTKGSKGKKVRQGLITLSRQDFKYARAHPRKLRTVLETKQENHKRKVRDMDIALEYKLETNRLQAYAEIYREAEQQTECQVCRAFKREMMRPRYDRDPSLLKAPMKAAISHLETVHDIPPYWRKPYTKLCNDCKKSHTTDSNWRSYIGRKFCKACQSRKKNILNKRWCQNNPEARAAISARSFQKYYARVGETEEYKKRHSENSHRWYAKNTNTVINKNKVRRFLNPEKTRILDKKNRQKRERQYDPVETHNIYLERKEWHRLYGLKYRDKKRQLKALKILFGENT